MNAKIKKMSCILLALFLLPVFLFADAVFDDFFEFKIKLYNQHDTAAIEKLITEYQASINKKSITEEQKLALTNLLILEKISTVKNDAENAGTKQVYKLLTAQNNATNNFMKNKKTADANVWLLLSWADIKSRLTAFLSGQDMYKEALAAKDLYQFILKKNKKFSAAHVSFGLWLYNAPPIAGGGYEASLKEFSNAVSSAKNVNEKYYALCCRSQAYFALGDTKKTDADLAEARTLIKDEAFTTVIIEANKNDKVFFEK